MDKEFAIGLFGWTGQPGLAEQVRQLLEHSSYSLLCLSEQEVPRSGSFDVLLLLSGSSAEQSPTWTAPWPVIYLGDASALSALGVVNAGLSRCFLPTDAPSSWQSRLLTALEQMVEPGALDRHMRSIPALVPDWSLVFDRRGTVQWAGEAWSEHAAAQRTEALPPVWDLLNLDAKRWSMCWNAVCSGATVSLNDHPVARSDGHLVFLDWDLIPGAQAGFGPAAAVFLARDVSERVRADEARERLKQERDSLQKDMDQFVEAASHDLKEPLRNVSNFVQLLRHRYGDQLGDEAADYIAYAVSGVRRMWDLMDELLLFANLTTARERYCWLPLADLLSDIMVQLDQPGSLTVRNLPEKIYGHPAQLALLFRHLLDNGFRYNAQNGRMVGVEGVDERNNWILSVWDNGSGIAPEYQQRAFSLFKRLHGQEENPGRGMGLSICRKIVDLHGGHIRLSSETGRGTALHLWLPKPAL